MSILPAAQWIFLLCSALAFASATRGVPRAAWLCALPFAGVCALSRAWPPSIAVACLAATVLAAWRLVRQPPAWVAPAAAGVLAACAASVHEGSGAPPWPAAVPALLAVLAARVLAQRRHRFAPPRLLEQALCGVVVLGPAVAAGPTLAEGWRSAQALNQAASGLASPAFPGWVWFAVLAAVAAGLLHGWWMRR